MLIAIKTLIKGMNWGESLEINAYMVLLLTYLQGAQDISI